MSSATLENQTLGKYEVGREIGRGSMGVVYHAHDPFTDEEVAIKVALPETLHDDETRRYRKLFFNEAKVAGMLRHPNIVRVHDAGVEGEVWFIVMEYVAGGRTLADHCRPERLATLEDAVRIGFRVATALDYAHRNGVVHRDIKPRNILLTEAGDVKIGDFSIALQLANDATDTQVHGYIGSPLYMSPEQIFEQDITTQTDVFAIGVVLYELLSGVHPFSADNLPAIIHRITELAHAPIAEVRSEIPPVLAHILDRALQKEPERRYKTALDLAADLSLVFDHIRLFEEELPSQEKFDLVKDLDFFAQFAGSEIWEVINASNWQSYEPEAEIIVEGELDSSFYVIVSGDVTVRKNGRELDVLGAGDCFGEMGFIAGKRRTASIIAQTEVMTLNVRASLMERASLDCQLRFHKIFLSTLIERLSRATDRMALPD